MKETQKMRFLMEVINTDLIYYKLCQASEVQRT